MIYIYLYVISFLLIIIISFVQTSKKKYFFFFLKINLLVYFQKIFIFLFLVFIFTIETFFLIDLFFNQWSIFEILKDLISNFSNSSTTLCAGVPSLIQSCDPRDQESDIITLLNIYERSTSFKTLSKYNFSLLLRDNNFYTNRTLQELNTLSMELYHINRSVPDIFEEIFNCRNLVFNNYDFIINPNPDKHIEIISKNLEFFYNENLYKLKTLELCNNKLGIPLYNNLYSNIFISKKPALQLLLQSKIHVMAIVPKYIYPFLAEPHVMESINTNHEIFLTFHKKCPLIAKQLNEKEHGLIYEYNRYVQSIVKTKNLLIQTNKTILNLKKLLLIPEFKTKILSGKPVINIEKKSKDFIEFSKKDNPIIYDSKLIFQKPINNEKISFKFQKIDEVFLNHLKKDSSLLRDIKNQQSDMIVDYTKLKQIMSSSNPEIQKYFDLKTKDRVLKASEGNFALKRLRS